MVTVAERNPKVTCTEDVDSPITASRDRACPAITGTDRRITPRRAGLVKRLGIVVAMAEEARTLGTLPRPVDALVRPAPGVVLCLSGIGPERAHAAAARLLDAGATALLSWGTAAGLIAGVGAGQLLLPREVLRMNGDRLPVSDTWRRQLLGQFAPDHRIDDRPLVSTARILTSHRQKQALWSRFGAAAADMESAAVAEAAAAADVPFVALRAVADSATTPVPDWVFEYIDAYGHPHDASLLRELLQHPADWPGLLQATIQFRAALRTLRAIGRPHGGGDLAPATWRRAAPVANGTSR